MTLSRDPIINVIENGFKRDIIVLLENKCYRGALTMRELKRANTL